MKRTLIFGLFALILAACTQAGGLETAATLAPAPPGKSCGNGVCSGPESAANCPVDCPAPAAENTPEQAAYPAAADTALPASHITDAPLYFTTMTHMEGNWNDDQLEEVFQRHVGQLRFGMDLASAYGALLTIESEKPFARANVNWNLNIMAEVRDRGFGVGTHCDIGYNEPAMAVEDFAALFRENKALVDALIGAENNLGCSGGGSVNDWAQAASMAGFKYLDGIVSMHYLSMPVQNRPSPEWTDAFIRSGNYHMNAPIDLLQRIYPFEVANAIDFNPDANPVIVISSGELGLLAAMAEKGREYGGSTPLRDDEYAFDQADIDTLVVTIREVQQTRDRSRIAKLCVYLPSSAYESENEQVLRYFFEQMRVLAEEGVITWATQRQVYEAYLAWNQ